MILENTSNASLGVASATPTSIAAHVKSICVISNFEGKTTIQRKKADVWSKVC